MTEVFNVIFDMFGSVIGWLKQIPITQNVSMFDFSLAILILTIVAVAFVPLVRVGMTSPTVDSAAERIDESRTMAAFRGIKSRIKNEIKSRRG